MKYIAVVFVHQCRLFFHDMGMIWFYIGGIVVFGVIFPLILRSETPQFVLAILMTATLQKQWAAESVALERENQTLESLLSTPISSKTLLFGKALFNFVCTIIYYVLMLVCILLFWHITRVGDGVIMPIGWLLFGVVSLCTFLVTTLYSVLVSAKVTSVRDAGRKATIFCYLFAFLLIVASSLLMDQSLSAWSTTVIVILLYLIMLGLMITYLLLQITKVNRSRLMMPEVIWNAVRKHKISYSRSGRRSQIQTVFVHEWRYFCTLKGLILMFCLLIVSPAIFLALGKYYLNQNNIYYAIWITILMIPRVPCNLIAYSVGGEKAYKTAESILSTSISVKALFIGKSAVPMLVCLIMLILSSCVTLVVTNLIAFWEGVQTLIFYDVLQSILLFAGGMLVSITMVLVTAILSLTAKSPRKGLYISTILGFTFILPILIIMYCLTNKIAGALIYIGFLVVMDTIIFQKISGMVREDIMMRL